ncbi:hypothetical protein LZ31DRAFT_544763 [Colletotrichum somersetense]|nr:hypothetical protein LZ31DRAFT_544763 [Colletotrichum somersetense]
MWPASSCLLFPAYSISCWACYLPVNPLVWCRPPTRPRECSEKGHTSPRDFRAHLSRPWYLSTWFPPQLSPAQPSDGSSMSAPQLSPPLVRERSKGDPLGSKSKSSGNLWKATSPSPSLAAAMAKHGQVKLITDPQGAWREGRRGGMTGDDISLAVRRGRRMKKKR